LEQAAGRQRREVWTCPLTTPHTQPPPQAFKCFMIEFWDLSQYHLTNNFTAMHHLQSLPGLGEPNCIHMPGNTRMCQVRGGWREFVQAG
jgi:hypothetical protein